MSYHTSYVQHFKVLKYYLFLLNEAGIKNSRKYFLPKEDVNNYNVLIDGRNFYDQPINDLIKQNDEERNVSLGKRDDYTTGCLLD